MSKKEKTNEDFNQEFVETLKEILSEYKASQLLHIPGIYEILSEEFNNDVLDKIKENLN